MRETHYREVLRSDVPAILKMKLREADVEECSAFLGQSSRAALLNTVEHSPQLWVIIHKENIEGVFGVTNYAEPWFVASDMFDEYWRVFARQTKRDVDMLFTHFNYLQNYVDSRHTASIRWIKWLGFTVEDTPHYFHDKSVPFFKFYKYKE